MAKQLLLVRHAKSDWGNADLADFDRPLNKRGKENAPEMAERLLKKGFKAKFAIISIVDGYIMVFYDFAK